MRTILLAFAMLAIIPNIAFSQSNTVKAFYEKYKTHENVTDVKLKGWVLKLASSFSDDETAERILKKITQLRVLVMEEGNLVSSKEYSRLISSLKKDKFEELMLIKEKSADIQFMIREKGNHISDLLLIVNDDDSFVLLSLEGMLDFRDLHEINIEIEGGDQFKKIPKDKKAVPRA